MSKFAGQFTCPCGLYLYSYDVDVFRAMYREHRRRCLSPLSKKIQEADLPSLPSSRVNGWSLKFAKQRFYANGTNNQS